MRRWLGGGALVGALVGLDCTSQPTAPPNEETREGALVRAPGPEVSAQLARKLQAAVAARGPGYVPRTRHLTPDGKPKFSNRLVLESSPYLLQHAHNPVNWFPWGPEAFALARALSRPVFLSVGYSTCHWCHVMEEESFEDEEIADVLNSRYIAIKVDREERPDVDALYMAAVQRLTGRGGWPMSVWLTPDKLPFFGGTYFPARDGDRGSRQGFLSLLGHQADAFATNPADVGMRAQDLAQRLTAEDARSRAAGEVDGSPLRAARGAATKRYDPIWGGSRGAPKFPSSFPIRLLLRFYREGEDPEALAMATTTLSKMAAGGLYDHVGGGFHRYSTDDRWLVPHFEKMLYDNAQLGVAYLEAYQITKDDGFARVARETLDCELREMSSPEGGFYSATDADSWTPAGRREEGYYFTWTPAELAGALPPDPLELVRQLYAVTDHGNFEGRNILHTPRPRDAVRRSLGLSKSVFERRLDRARATLRSVRAQRPAPLRDDKIQVSWNALMISALARAALVLDEPGYGKAALRAMQLMMTTLRPDGRLRHATTGGQLSTQAFLDDHAFLAVALLDVFELNFDRRYLEGAIDVMNDLEALFLDEEGGGYFLTARDGEQLLVRQKPRSDGAIPNGNSLALEAQLRLHALTTDDTWRRRAERTLTAFAEPLSRYPAGLDVMLLGLSFREGQPREIVIVASDPAQAKPLLDVVHRQFLPRRVLVSGTEAELDQRFARRIPWATGKPRKSGRATAYVCEQGSCELPTTSPTTLAAQLARAAAEP